jgi:hypothetical protein
MYELDSILIINLPRNNCSKDVAQEGLICGGWFLVTVGIVRREGENTYRVRIRFWVGGKRFVFTDDNNNYHRALFSFMKLSGSPPMTGSSSSMPSLISSGTTHAASGNSTVAVLTTRTTLPLPGVSISM